MKRAIVLAVVLLPAVARAEEFENKAQGAVKVSRHADLVWALTAPCDKGDDVHQRQCKVVRDRKAKALTGATLWMTGDTDAVEAAKWNPQKKSVAVTVNACVHCGPVDVDGKAWSIIGHAARGGAARVDGGKVRGATLYDNARPFADEATATAWTKTLAAARFEVLAKVPDKRRIQVGGKDAIALDVIAWRVVNPCDGSIVLSSVPSAAAEPDRKACSATGARPAVPLDGADALTPGMVQDAMRPVVAIARQCATRMKMTGRAKLEITIHGDGTIAKYQQTGDFVGTSLGKCIDDAMRSAVFPKTKKPTTKIGFPIVLQ